jgi:hypothetical protein
MSLSYAHSEGADEGAERGYTVFLNALMSGECHDRGVTRLRFGKLCNGMMAAVVKAETFDPGRLRQFSPCRTPTLLATLWVNMAVFTSRKQEVFRLSAVERLSAAIG